MSVPLGSVLGTPDERGPSAEDSYEGMPVSAFEQCQYLVSGDYGACFSLAEMHTLVGHPRAFVLMRRNSQSSDARRRVSAMLRRPVPDIPRALEAPDEPVMVAMGGAAALPL